MWGDVDNRKQMLEKAIKFTGDHVLYGSYMMRVIYEWPNSCDNALTDYQMNRKAWVGHAACALAIRCPEDITRQAWGFLTDEQRLLANAEAERAIQSWELRKREGKSIRQHMAQAVLF
jgi:hypothetical protein